VEWLKALQTAGDGSGWSGVPDRFTPLFLLTASARVVAVDGYRSKAAALAYNEKVDDGGRTVSSTADATGTYLDALAGRLPKGYDKFGNRYDANAEVLAHFGEVTDEDAVQGAAVLAFALAHETDSTYGYNLSTAARAELVEWRHAGLLVSAHGGYAREQGKARERAAAPVKENAHLGTVGSKLQVTAAAVSASTFEGNYGTTTLVTFATPTGVVLKWWATGNKVGDFPAGTVFDLQGTVKAHDEYKGIKQTVLTRVKVKEAA
jgi:hypothetical protein